MELTTNWVGSRKKPTPNAKRLMKKIVAALPALLPLPTYFHSRMVVAKIQYPIQARPITQGRAMPAVLPGKC